MLKTQRMMLWGLSLLLVASILAYSLSVFWPLITKPSINITSPENGESVSGTELVVRGEIKNINKLFLNNFPVQISKSGTFESRLAIWEGHTILILTGYDRFGRSVTVSRIIGTK